MLIRVFSARIRVPRYPRLLVTSARRGVYSGLYQEFTEKASKYVDTLGFSQPKKGASETMHSLARKLNVTLPSKMTPAKPELTHAIVVEKLRSVDTTAALNYE